MTDRIDFQSEQPALRPHGLMVHTITASVAHLLDAATDEDAWTISRRILGELVEQLGEDKVLTQAELGLALRRTIAELAPHVGLEVKGVDDGQA